MISDAIGAPGVTPRARFLLAQKTNGQMGHTLSSARPKMEDNAQELR
jgi:hypothetical protein